MVSNLFSSLRVTHRLVFPQTNRGNALLVIMAIASVSGLMIWSMSNFIENRNKERRLDAAKSIRNEVWRTVSTYAADPAILREVGQLAAAGTLTEAGDVNLATCLGYIAGTCNRTSSGGVFNAGTNDFNAAATISLVEQRPPGSGTLAYITRAGSNPVYYSTRGERDCTKGGNCIFRAKAAFFARCRNNTATCTTAESITVVTQVRHDNAGLTAADKKVVDNLALAAYPSSAMLTGNFTSTAANVGWDRVAKQTTVIDIRGEWGCPTGAFPDGIRAFQGAGSRSSGLPLCKCFWETYPTLKDAEKDIIRATLTLDTNGHPTDCLAKLNTYVNAQPPVLCPADKPIYMGFKFVGGQPEPICESYTMTELQHNVPNNSTVNCASLPGGSPESRLCNLDVSTCTMNAAKVITCSDAKVGCCNPQ